MAAGDDPKVMGRTRLSFATQADVDEFVTTLQKFESGELPPDQWRAFRLLRGLYGQRQTYDAQMLRIKIPQGILEAGQLAAIAEVSEKYSRGFGHITTRQNIQLHFVKLHEAEKAMQTLAEHGLTTREACGNSVRNITTCPYAGVAHDEPFDVTPYAEETTRYFLGHPLAASLPRKFKIAFEGCKEDHAVTAINDLGFKARVRVLDGVSQRGFRVTVAGGTAILCNNGYLLFDFLPVDQLFNVSEAVLRVFHKLGDRQHRQKNRSKFLVRQLGWEAWKAEFQKELDGFVAEGGAKLPFEKPHAVADEPAPSHVRPAAPGVGEVAARAVAVAVKGPGIVPDVRPVLTVAPAAFAHWKRTNVSSQKQAGFSMVHVTVTLGDFTGQQMRVLGELSRAYGDGQVRVTVDQNLVFRWIHDADIPALYERLAAVGLGLPDATTVANVTACPGAEACKLAVTQSRGLGKALGDYLREKPELVAQAPDLNVKISGCPNGCGQHHIAGLGFQGSVRKVGDKVVPQYFVLVGGGVDPEGAHFGRLAAKIPARRLTTAVDRLIGFYGKQKAPGQTATDFFRRVEVAQVKALLSDLEAMTAANATKDDFIDLGEDTEFKPETSEGECAT
jgi:sulfite reductase beta subunit-like hemoprotein